jgi:hypothetical protein
VEQGETEVACTSMQILIKGIQERCHNRSVHTSIRPELITYIAIKSIGLNSEQNEPEIAMYQEETWIACGRVEIPVCFVPPSTFILP